MPLSVGEAFQGKHGISTKGLIASGLAATIGLCAILIFVIWQDYNQEALKARRAGANLVATIAADIDRNLELYGLSLQAVVDGLKEPDISKISPEMRQLVLFDRAATAKDLGSIFVLDNEGNVVLDSHTLNPAHSNHANRDYFLVQKYGLSGGLYLSSPWTTPEGDNLIAISRRLTNPDGSFKGAVVGTLRLAFFDKLFRQVHLGTGDSLTLVRDDGSIVMRAPFSFEDIGRNVASTPIFQQVVWAPAGFFKDVSRLDGIERLYVFQHIGEYPLTLNYGASVDAIYASWRVKAWVTGALTLLLCGIDATLIVFLVRALRRRSEAEYRLSIAAATDGLTQLCNRRRLDEILNETWREAMTTATSSACLMIDVDHFKNYNDAFGHQIGDEALKAIACCIKSSLPRSSDVAARYGGEEFAVLLPNASADTAVAVGERIRASVLALRADQHGRVDSTPTISIGVASVVPRYGLQPRDLLKAADMALYEAKRNGRNCVEAARGLADIKDVPRAA
jgi:diguanylate cyclase (GGDEF)-like protein